MGEAPVNGQVQERRIHFSLDQADLFKQLIAATNEAQGQMQFALMAAGLSDENIIGGNLDADKPYFVVEDLDGIDLVE